MNTGRGKRLLSSPKHPHCHWGPPNLVFNGYRSTCLGVKQLGCEINHSPLSGAKDRNDWSYTPTPTICLHGVDSMSQ